MNLIIRCLRHPLHIPQDSPSVLQSHVSGPTVHDEGVRMNDEKGHCVVLWGGMWAVVGSWLSVFGVTVRGHLSRIAW